MDGDKYGLSEKVYYKSVNNIYDNLYKIGKEIGGRKVFIYGAGRIGRLTFDILRENNIFVDGFLDTMPNIGMYCNKQIFHPYQIINDDVYIMLAVKESMVALNLLSPKFPDDIFVVYEDYNMICTNMDIQFKGVKIGRGTYGYKSLIEDFPICTSIGRYCSINPTARILNNHPMDYVTTSPILD